MKNLILIDKNNKQIGTKGKLESHLGNGSLHRAFTCILINSKNQILLTQRSLKKPLWPTYWDLSFSSHPWVDEDLEIAVVRRANQELGIKIKSPKLLFNYQYQIKWNEIFAENEINHFFITQFNGELKPNPEEISNSLWLNKSELNSYIKENNDKIAPWVIIPFKKLLKNL